MVRLPALQTTYGGVALTRVHYDIPFGVTRIRPGDRRHFQCWFRDPASGGAATQLSDAFEIVFCP